jgi:SAM-dependent methyltransferase
LKHVWRAARRALPRVRRLQALGCRGGRLLDVGAGGGEFLYLMRAAGWQVQGLEPNAGYGEFARQSYDLDIELLPLEQAEFPAQRFDVITVNHVLEHLRDPIAALRRLRGWLQPDGVLVVEVPNVQAHYHAPGTRFHFAHLYNFSRVTLLATAARAGFAPLDVALTPGVCHLDAAFRPAPETMPRWDAAHARAVSEDLRRHTWWRHYLGAAPYRRLLANLWRPIAEALAIRGKRSAREVLDGIAAEASARSLRP